MHEGEEDRARRWLSGVVVPPTRLTAAGLVRSGQERVRRRRLVTVAGVAVAVAVAAVPSAQLWQWYGTPPVPAGPAASACTLIDLAPPPGLTGAAADAAVTAVDASGRYLAGHWGEAVVRWDDGVPTVLEVPDEFGVVSGVNEHGDLLGDNGWVYRQGRARPLAGAERVQRVGGLNAAGEVVGLQRVEGSLRYVVWPAGGGEPRLLPLPDGADAERAGHHDTARMAITADGSVVGELPQQLGGGLYVWPPDGDGQPLALPEHTEASLLADAAGDWAVGFSAGRVSAPVRWDLRTGQVSTLTLPETDSPGHAEAVAVTPGGDVVIRWVEGDMAGVAQRPMLLLRDGSHRTLPLPENARSLGFAMVVSDDGGVVAGNVEVAAGAEVLLRPVVWRCPVARG